MKKRKMIISMTKETIKDKPEGIIVLMELTATDIHAEIPRHRTILKICNKAGTEIKQATEFYNEVKRKMIRKEIQVRTLEEN